MASSKVVRSALFFFIILIVAIAIFLIINLNSGDDTKPGEKATAEAPASAPGPETVIPQYPIDYSIGSCDQRFGISFEKFRALLKDASSTWEEPAGTTLFSYEESATFKVNLIYDERQERTNEEKQARVQLDEHTNSYEALDRDYKAATRRQEELQKSYDSSAAIVIGKTNEYNAKVEQWNKSGGAPQTEIGRLNAEKAELDKLKEKLAVEELALKKSNDDVNTLATRVNESVQRRNSNVASYNGKFGESRPFEQGLFNGKEINVYQFEDEARLKLALIHEFGHALGFQHVDDSTAIMYYKTGYQDREHIHLTEKDLELVRKKFSK